jgi:hypothetical protein
LAKINPYSNPLYVLEELIQALKTDDPEISGALDRIAALTGIQKQALLDTASDAHNLDLTDQQHLRCRCSFEQ